MSLGIGRVVLTVNSQSRGGGALKRSIMACATLVALTVWPAAASSATILYSRGTDTAVRILASHNSERARLNLPPLQWDPQLAASAAAYGPMLASIGRLQHSPRAMRPGQRENLWMGTRGFFSPEQMVGTWINERREFRPGVF